MTADQAQQPLDIDVFTDIACPWCFIGIRRLEQALAPWPAVNVRYHTYLLAPELGSEGVELAAHLRSKYGRDPGEMFARVEAEARQTGIPLDFGRVTHMRSTVAAQTLVRYAHSKNTHRALTNDLFEAYFLAPRDIASIDVLVELGARHGFSATEARRLLEDEEEQAITRREAERTRAMGITGVPFFVFGGKYALSGAQPVEAFADVLGRFLA